MKKHKSKIMAGIIILTVLSFVFWYGGDAPSLRGWQPEQTLKREDKIENTKTEQKVSEMPIRQADEVAFEENKPQNTDDFPKTSDEKETLTEMTIDEATGKDKYLTDPVPDGKPIPIEPQEVVISDKEYTCTLSVRCDTILNKIEWIDSEKVDIVPKDGVIFTERTVTFYEGESVFNLLLREMKKNKIHMEFVNTPIYNSAYIEGIANLYEFDCGELSGWMYKVNDWFPNYGCSRYQLKAGDRVEWVYTCDLGKDVGGHYSARNGN